MSTTAIKKRIFISTRSLFFYFPNRDLHYCLHFSYLVNFKSLKIKLSKRVFISIKSLVSFSFSRRRLLLCIEDRFRPSKAFFLYSKVHFQQISLSFLLHLWNLTIKFCYDQGETFRLIQYGEVHITTKEVSYYVNMMPQARKFFLLVLCSRHGKIIVGSSKGIRRITLIKSIFIIDS